MKRFILAALAIGFAWLSLAAGPAAAQNTYPYQAPRYGPGWQTPLSPYLLMMVPGNAAVNYYNLVEPQFQARQYRNLTSQTIQGILNQIPEPPGIMSEEALNAPMPGTGHPTAVNYTGSYFATLTGQPFSSEGAYGQRAMMMGRSQMGAGRGPGMGGGMMGMMRPGMGMGGGMMGGMRPGFGFGR
jgi:hypothetical protein